MKTTNKILFEKIRTMLKSYLKFSQLREILSEADSASFPEIENLPINSGREKKGDINLKDIKTRNFIDKTITYAERNLGIEDYQKLQYDLSLILAECDEMNIAEEILTNLINDTKTGSHLKAESLLGLADILIRKSFWDKSIVLIVTARELFGDLNDSIGLAKCENMCGTYYGERGEIVSARNHFVNSLNLLKENEDDKLEARIESNLAILEVICGNCNIANKYFINAIEKFEKVGELKRMAEQQHNLGMMYLEQKEYEKAIKEFDGVIELAANKQYQTILTISYLGKANALALMNNNKAGLEYCYKAMDIAVKIEDRMTIADVYRVIGIIERNYKHYDLAEKYLNISMRLNDEIKNRLNTAETSYEFGLLYNESGNETEKSDWLKKALKYYEEIKASSKVNNISGLLSSA